MAQISIASMTQFPPSFRWIAANIEDVRPQFDDERYLPNILISEEDDVMLPHALRKVDPIGGKTPYISALYSRYSQVPCPGIIKTRYFLTDENGDPFSGCDYQMLRLRPSGFLFRLSYPQTAQSIEDLRVDYLVNIAKPVIISASSYAHPDGALFFAEHADAPALLFSYIRKLVIQQHGRPPVIDGATDESWIYKWFIKDYFSDVDYY